MKGSTSGPTCDTQEYPKICKALSEMRSVFGALCRFGCFSGGCLFFWQIHDSGGGGNRTLEALDSAVRDWWLCRLQQND